MVRPAVMSRHEVDDAVLKEISEACHISPDQIEDVYTCTPLQNRAMAESAINSGASVYQFVSSLKPSVDLDRWCAAVRQVASLNPILRARLVDSSLGLLQVVVNEDHETKYLSGDDVTQYMSYGKAHPPGLGETLLRSVIIGQKWVVMMHHALMDHTSLIFLFQDVLDVYHGKKPEERADFNKFVDYCFNIDDSAAKSFWASRFKGAPTIFPKVEPGYTPNASETVTTKLLFDQVAAEVSLSHLPSYIEAAWALTARAYTSSDSIAYGVVLAGRTPALAGLENTMGPTIATIPVQVNVKRNMTVEAVIKERNMALRQLQTQPALQYGMSRISAVSDAARTASSFQTLLNIRASFYVPDDYIDMKYEYTDGPNGAFGLCLNFAVGNDHLEIQANSDPAIVCESQLQRIVRQFEHTLRSLLEADLQTKLSQLPVLNPHDRLEILEWNKSVPQAVEKRVYELFRAQAQAQPGSKAIEAWDGSITYNELDNMSDRLAHELRRIGVSTGSPVPFIFEKSLWTVVAIFGIMKAGGACVPIERADPRARKAAIVSGANAKVILTSTSAHADSADLAPQVLAVNAESISKLPDIKDCITSDSKPFSAGDLAYIIFTSGSTGLPKGVMLEHRCLASSLTALAQRFGWGPGNRVLQFAAHVWDISMGEMFGTLLFGGCLCIPSEADRQSNLAHFIKSHKVNWAWLTPTVLRTLSPEEVPSLRSLISLGEPVNARAYKTWGSALHFINGWGPCEASIISAGAILTPTSLYPESIGSPIGSAIWLASPGNMNELAPIGAIGEILIEGPGVARGYLNDKAKTAYSFISPPAWSPAHGSKTSRLFCTGDMAKYNPDGSISFIGRQDNQVKIRGQRFELGELENVLTSTEEARDVYTTTKIASSRTELVAVICLSDPNIPREHVLQEVSDDHVELATRHLRSIRSHAKAKLPSFMVPTVWLAVELMPRTPSAKLDRVSLKEWLKTRNLSQARDVLDSQKTAVLTPPATAEERLLQSVWSSVLGVREEQIGRESSFVQAGGDSILAMQVASRCQKRGLQLTTAALLRGESLAVIAKSSVDTQLNGDSSLTSAGRTLQEPPATIPDSFISRLSKIALSNGRYKVEDVERIAPATDAQAYMLASGQLGEKGYLVQFNLDFKPSLDSARLRKACEKVFENHPILRTIFFQHGPALHQAILKVAPSESVVDVIKESPLPTVNFQDGDVLTRFLLSRDEEGCHRLRLYIHHALYDAFSLELIFRDLFAAYQGEPLSSGPQFHTWVSHVKGLDDTAAQEYWRGVLKDSSISYLVPPVPGATHCHPLDEQIKFKVPLQRLQNSFGTPSHVMKAAWSLVLSLATGTNDVTFGEVSTNRYLPVAGLDEVRGPCVNNLPVRAKISQGMTLASLIAQIQEQSTNSLPHHHLGYRSIIKSCTTWPQWSRFSTAIAYQNHGSLKSPLKIGDVQCELSGDGKIGDSADLFVIANPGQEDLDVEINYSSSLFHSEQLRWIVESLSDILEGIPSYLAKDLNHVKDSLRSSMGSYSMSSGRPELPNGYIHTRPPSSHAREVVSGAWREIELTPGSDSEGDFSMFNCGGDMITAFLLSKYYIFFGYDISTRDIIANPSHLLQASLLDSKRPNLISI